MLLRLSSKPRILILEDQPAMSTFMRKALAPATQVCFDLLMASSVREAHSLIDYWVQSGAVIGGAICDYHLGDGNGTDVIKHLHDLDPEMPVIVSSGWADDMQVRKALGNLKIDMTLVKPFSLAELAFVFQTIMCPISQWKRPGHSCLNSFASDSKSGVKPCWEAAKAKGGPGDHGGSVVGRASLH
jgi:DNA-binding NtrC family response regulator